MKRKFKLYNNRPSQRIDEMSANDLQLLKTKASSMANACGYADDDKGQNFWIGVECNCEERLKELGASTCEYCKNENLIFQNNKEASMSELKAKHVVDVYDNYAEHPCEELSQVYLKPEADKVIAEKDAKIIQLEALIENYNRISREIIDNANHQKHKRCLAMAEWCDAESDVADADGDYEDMLWYQKWHQKWLELAEKFKPNSTAQQGKG